MAEQGIIYVLTNPAMPGMVKIGRTQVGGLEARIRQLQTTGVPLPFVCERASLVEDPERVEALVHIVFGDQRVNQRREFFRAALERTVAALQLAELKDVTPGRDILSSEPAEATAMQQALDAERAKVATRDHIDTLIVAARDTAPDGSAGFNEVFLGENRWYEFRISKPYRERVKWIAAYRIRPIQAVTHIAPIARFEPSPNTDGYWMAVFAEPAHQLERPIPQGEAGYSLMQGPRYTNKEKLLAAQTLVDLFACEDTST